MLNDRFRLRSVLTGTLLVAVCVAVVWKFTPQLRAGSPILTAGSAALGITSTSKTTTRQVSPALRALHNRYVKAFVESEGFGESRLVRFDDPFRESIENDGQLYLVRKLELISLQNHDVPVAYVNHFKNPVKNRLKLGTTRPLTEFEQRALEKLRAGEQFLFNDDTKLPQCIGAIRAQTMCLECHDAKVGELLGAFSYGLSSLRSRDSYSSLRQRVKGAP